MLKVPVPPKVIIYDCYFIGPREAKFSHYKRVQKLSNAEIRKMLVQAEIISKEVPIFQLSNNSWNIDNHIVYQMGDALFCKTCCSEIGRTYCSRSIALLMKLAHQNFLNSIAVATSAVARTAVSDTAFLGSA